MSFLRGLLWFLFAIGLIAVAMYITGNYELAQSLQSLFLAQSITFDFDKLLVIVTVASLILVALAVSGCTAAILFMAGRLSLTRQRQLGQAVAAKREVGHIGDQHQRQYDQLIALSQGLTKRLDKRVLVQGIVEAASRVTSVPQANSLVSLWLVHLETDTLGFEIGLYCDETLFTKTAFQPVDQPFSRVIPTQKAMVFSSWSEAGRIIKPEKAAQGGTATSMLVVPLVIENDVLGVLVMCCHPDIVKSYESQKPFYETLWGELTLALAIAIQGELAILDRLTGLHHREYFMKRLIQEVERANRFQFPLALLMIDIDNFKLVNDMLGHPQGDAVLRIVAKLTRKEVRAIDLAGRYGGEEFIILLPETGYGDETTSAAGALVVAERIRKAVDEEFHGLQKPLNLTVSIGVAVRRFPEDKTMDMRELIRLADEQLYRAKTTGKNKVCVYVPEKPQEVS